MKRFIIVANSTKDENLILAGEVQSYLQMHGASAEICADADNIPVDCSVECAIVLGGDGTMLLASSKLSEKGIPMIGINLGTMGFMADVDPRNMEEALECLLQDQYRVEERMNLIGTIYHEGKEMATATALNDIVIARSGYSRIICLRIYVNGELLDVYEADGVIIATPTGSTAYNLSAGGPIVSPNASLILVTPVSPHSLTSKSVVFSAEDEIEVEIVPKRKSQKEEAFATFDGRGYEELQLEDRVRIRRALKPTRLVKIYQTSFYEILRSKMGESNR
ncbi:MAG: NAD(+)/NADH kinase [Lachnospiraceae bacterium]|nr:NAD(+)/NADH kinase [Lachnospiraceae bacterium]MBP3506445.1 NAD(+)/NADH kinase [Lachnospiraceae bacterium]